MIAMIVVGCVLIPMIAVWEIKFAKRPVLARRLLKNRTVQIAAWIGFFDFVRRDAVLVHAHGRLTAVLCRCRSS